MRRIPIRMKLAAALAIPLVALLVVTLVEVVSISRQVDEIHDETQLARAAVGPSGLITRIQDERTWAAVELVGSEQYGIWARTPDYAQSRAATDEAITSFREEITRRGDAAVEAYAPALDALEGIAQIRADIDGNRANHPDWHTSANRAFADPMYIRYTELIRPFFDATDAVILSIDDPELRRGAELVNVTSRHIELFSDMARHALISGSLDGGITTREQIDAAVGRMVAWQEGSGTLARAEAPYDRVVAQHYPHEFMAAFTQMYDSEIRGQTFELGQLFAPLQEPESGGLQGFRVALAREVNAVADDLSASAATRERMFLALALTALVLGVLLAWLVSRSITRPLRSLTAQAKEMARHRLPAAVLDVLHTPLGEDVRVPQVAPVAVTARDEVSEVASALNRVQDTALDLAVEQAVLRRNIADSFVNLGRRNQNLLVRQLDFITSLETVETDPDSLSNLFRLDHLATRMRRNAESLLVLAGIEPPRQWAAPVRISDVVRASLGEVEDYQRVAVRGVEPATILGSAASDLAHLLAELIENALTFSPPDMAVDIRGRTTAGGGYTLGVIDGGQGMAIDAIDAANRRLAGQESFTVAPSKYLGHYVAGNLAARHGIGLRLAPSTGGRGVTATVDLPAELIHRDALEPPSGGGHWSAQLGAGGGGGLPRAGGVQGLPGAGGVQGLPGAGGVQGLPGAGGMRGLPA